MAVAACPNGCTAQSAARFNSGSFVPIDVESTSMNFTMDALHRCPRCHGTVYPGDARCRICTAPLYLDAVVDDPIDDSFARRYQRHTYGKLLAVVSIVCVAAFLANYFWFRLGPSWAYRAEQAAPTETWSTVTDLGGPFTVRLPGRGVEDLTVPDATEQRTTVVNASWEPVLDQTTTSPAAQLAAKRTRVATVVAAALPGAPSDRSPVQGFEAAVAAMAPGAQLSSVRSEIAAQDPLGVRADLVGSFDGYPTPGRQGRVMATKIQRPDGTILVAVFEEAGSATEMYQFLVSSIRR